MVIRSSETPKSKGTAARLSRSATARALAQAHAVHERFKKVMDERFGLRADYLREDDLWRLLTLKRMLDIQNVDFEEGIGVMMEFWMENPRVRKAKSRDRRTLPVRIWNLTGKTSQDVLQEYLQKTYPLRENEKIRRQELKDALLSQVMDDDPKSYALDGAKKLFRDYVRTLEEDEKEREKAVRRVGRRRWRGNPWMEV